MPKKPDTHTPHHKKVANSLVTLSSAAVLAVYAAGYQRTRSAAEQLEAAAAQRRPVVPAPAPTRMVVPNSLPVAAAAGAPIERAVEATQLVEPLPKPAATTTSQGAAVEDPAVVARSTPAASPSAAAAPEVPAAIPQAPAPTQVAAVDSPATEPAAKPAAADSAPKTAAATPQYKDGTFHAWGRSRHGDIYTFVVIEKGRIVHSGYDKCQTRWSCDLVDHLGPQVVKRQSAEVDYVSGATESGNAFYWGIVEALAQARIDAPPPATGEAAAVPK